MVRGILSGAKTQTRRVVKPQSHEIDGVIYHAGRYPNLAPCKFGTIGDVLWVRETWRPKTHDFPTGWRYEYRATAEQDFTPTDGPWKPSLFMPRDACRICLEITDVRVERLNDISEADAKVEGVKYIQDGGNDGPIWEFQGYVDYMDKHGDNLLSTAKESYKSLWEKINGLGSWDKNPWVFVIEFKMI